MAAGWLDQIQGATRVTAKLRGSRFQQTLQLLTLLLLLLLLIMLLDLHMLITNYICAKSTLVGSTLI